MLVNNRILHLTTVHPRSDVRIFHKMCVDLACAGFSTFFMVADGLGDSEINNVQILDIGKKRGRLLRMLLSPWVAYRRIKDINPKLIHVHDPELLILAYILMKCGFIVIYDAHEDVPKQMLMKHWILPVFRRPVAYAARFLEEFVSRRLTAVVAATEEISNRFCAVGCKSLPVYNYPKLSQFFSPVSRREENLICYVGAISQARGIVELVKALEYLPTVRLLLAGKFETPTLKDEVSQMPAWERVEYFGVIGRDEVKEILLRSSLGILTLWPTSNYLESSPIKLYEYMAAALPVVLSDFPIWSSLAGKIGVSVNPKNPEEISRAINYLLSNAELSVFKGLAGQEIALRKYEWSVELAKLIGLYSDCGVSIRYPVNES